MLDPLLRPAKDAVLGPLARRLEGVAPNALTALSLGLGLGSAWAVWQGDFGVALGLWAANRVMDGLDGAVARAHGRVSDLGGYLDLVADFVVYAAIPLALALRPGAAPGAPGAALVLLATFYVNAAAWMVPAALLEKRARGATAARDPRGPTSIPMPEGVVSGTETVLFYTAFLLAPAHVVALFIAMAVLTAATVAQRVLWGARTFRGPGGMALALLAAATAFAGPGALTGQAAERREAPPTRVEGVVREAGGGPLDSVRVAVLPGGPSTLTGARGRFALEVADSARTLRFTRRGYLTVELPLPSTPHARRGVAVTLQRLFDLRAVEVVAERQRPLLNTVDAGVGGAVEARELEALPSDARDPLRLGLTIPGVAQATGFFGDAPPLTITGANALYTRYLLDGLDNQEGFLGGPRVQVPLAALARLDVHTAAYRPGLGRSSNGVVAMRSRPGGERWRGEVLAFHRPGTPLDADPAYAPPGVDPDGFQRLQLGGALSGPVVAERTYVAAAAEVGREEEDRIGSTARTAFLGTEERTTWKLYGRLDHGWSEEQTTTLRVAASDQRRRGRGGGVIVPEADITTRRRGWLAALTHRSGIAGGRGAHAVSLQLGGFRWDLPPAASDLTTPRVTIVAPDLTTVEAVVGSSNFVFDESELQLQLREHLEVRLDGGHTLGVGVDVVHSRFELRGAATNPVGAYTVVNEGDIRPAGRVLSIDDVPADVRVLRYTVDARPQQVNLTQTLWSAFVEDAWRVTPSLTLVGGVRWDYDDLTSRGESAPDLDNVQPRISVNWLAGPDRVLRAGWGLYTGVLPYAVYSDAVQFGPEGNAVVTFEEGTDAAPPAFGAGPGAAELAAQAGRLPPREVRLLFARGLEQATSSQLVVGVQQGLGATWSVAVDGIWSETRDLPRSWDLNPVQYRLQPGDSVDRTPAFGDTLRPRPPGETGARRLTTTDTGGRSRYLALQTHLRRARVGGLGLEASWVWSRMRNDTEDINFHATQGNDFDAEWADAVNDRRHRVNVRLVWSPLDALEVAGVVDWQTGTPVNRVAFFRDLDGSGAIFGNGFIGNHDRFVGVPRNGERLPAAWTLDASVAWWAGLGPGRLGLRVDGFNLLDRTNLSGFVNGIPGGGPRTQVGRPGDPMEFAAAAPPRQVQLSATWRF
jgi:phosphatidylglycerophosphate synthase